MGINVDDQREDFGSFLQVESDHLCSMCEPDVNEQSGQSGVPAHDPFKCPVCKERYRNPLLFPGCCHSVCEVCVDAITVDDQTLCPRCKSHSPRQELQEDRLLHHLIKSTGDEEVQCANCDEDSESKYFCNTCSQPLCQTCRDNTHASKMFASHNIVTLEQRYRDSQNMSCPDHKKDYIMFSMEDKRLLCINCFRDMEGGSRSQCIDLESAYTNNSARLKHSIVKLQQLERSVDECINLIQVLVSETAESAVTECKAVEHLVEGLIAKLEEKKDTLVETITRQQEEKVIQFNEQLQDMIAYMPVIRGSLETSNVFSGSTNRYEFLNLVDDMVDRLEKVAMKPPQLTPVHRSHVQCSYRTEIARSLEQLLGVPVSRSRSPMLQEMTEATPSPKRLEVVSTAMVSLCTAATVTTVSSAAGTSSSPFNARHRNNAFPWNGNGASVISEDIGSGTFAKFCQSYASTSKSSQQRLDVLKKKVQELHLDLTRRRCQPKPNDLERIREESHQIGQDLAVQRAQLHQQENAFEMGWAEASHRIQQEREIYKSYIGEVVRLVEENDHLLSILQSIEPFVTSLKDVAEILDPRLGVSSKDRQQQGFMTDILEKISATQPNSKQRVEAIRSAQDLRQHERRRSNVLEDSLIKTKGMLKSAARKPKSDT